MQLTSHACPHPANKFAAALWVGIIAAACIGLVTRDSLAYVVAGLAVLPLAFLIVCESFFSRVLMSSSEARTWNQWQDGEHKHTFSHLASGRNLTVAIVGMVWGLIGGLIVTTTQDTVAPAQAGLLTASVLLVLVGVWQWGAGKLRGFLENPHSH